VYRAISNFEFICAVAVILPGLVAVCLAGLPGSGVPPRTRGPRGSTLKIIQLPEAKLTGSLSLEEALTKLPAVGRARQFSGQGLKPTQIGQLAWAGLATMEKPPPSTAQTAPQRDQTYPIQLNQFGRDSDCKPKDRNKQKGTWVHLQGLIAGDGFIPATLA
jgi:hypothetical protein